MSWPSQLLHFIERHAIWTVCSFRNKANASWGSFVSIPGQWGVESANVVSHRSKKRGQMLPRKETQKKKKTVRENRWEIKKKNTENSRERFLTIISKYYEQFIKRENRHMSVMLSSTHPTRVGKFRFVMRVMTNINWWFSDWRLPSSRASSPSDMSSSSEQMLSTLTSISVTFSPTNGSDHVNTSMKFGSQYGWGEQLNCLMFITLFSYFKTAA